MNTSATPTCPECGFRIYNRRFPNCESCGATLPETLVYSPIERFALQAHQLGMISGIRAIIAAMLQSFNPEQLEEQAKQNGMTSRLALPGSRKAALWDYFVRSYGETAGEIEDDFHTLFGEAFLHAYDMEVNQYKDSQSGSEDK